MTSPGPPTGRNASCIWAWCFMADLTWSPGVFSMIGNWSGISRAGGTKWKSSPFPGALTAAVSWDNLSPNLGQRLRRAHFEVLLEDELAHPSLFLLNRWLRRRVSYPLVAIVHHLRSSEARAAWQNQLYRWVEGSYLASVDGFICNSQTTRAEVESLVGAGRPVVVAPPGGDHLPGKFSAAQVAARALAPGPLKIIAVANLIPRKGIHTLITPWPACLTTNGNSRWQAVPIWIADMPPAFAARPNRRRLAPG